MTLPVQACPKVVTAKLPSMAVTPPPHYSEVVGVETAAGLPTYWQVARGDTLTR